MSGKGKRASGRVGAHDNDCKGHSPSRSSAPPAPSVQLIPPMVSRIHDTYTACLAIESTSNLHMKLHSKKSSQCRTGPHAGQCQRVTPIDGCAPHMHPTSNLHPDELCSLHSGASMYFHAIPFGSVISHVAHGNSSHTEIGSFFTGLSPIGRNASFDGRSSCCRVAASYCLGGSRSWGMESRGLVTIGRRRLCPAVNGIRVARTGSAF